MAALKESGEQERPLPAARCRYCIEGGTFKVMIGHEAPETLHQEIGSGLF